MKDAALKKRPSGSRAPKVEAIFYSSGKKQIYIHSQLRMQRAQFWVPCLGRGF